VRGADRRRLTAFEVETLATRGRAARLGVGRAPDRASRARSARLGVAIAALDEGASPAAPPPAGSRSTTTR
jgi:hypothetical protein